MKITLICGGPSSEHQVSLDSTTAILKHIDWDKYDISLFYITRDLNCTCIELGKNSGIPPLDSSNMPLIQGIETYLTKCDMAILSGIHGEFVEDGSLQALLDIYHIPYTGSGMQASALAMDKFNSTSLVNHTLGINIPATKIFDIEDKKIPTPQEYPMVFKPNNAGSSVGVSILQSQEKYIEAVSKAKKESKFRYWLIQEYIDNAVEISCGCLQKKNGDFIMLPPIEIIPCNSPFFDYTAKYQSGGSTEIVPPEHLPKELSQKISQISCDIHQALRCKTYSRSDFLIKNGTVYYLETNTLPGMTDTSLLPQETAAIGIDFRKLIDFIIQESL